MPEAAEEAVDASVASYRENGYARLGQVIDDRWLASLRERTDDLMLGRVAYDGLFFQHDAESYQDLTYGRGYVGPSLTYRKLEKLEKDPLFFAHLQNPLFERVARKVIDGAISIYRATIFNKATEGSSALPWHQDGGSYWGLDREPVLQIWTALDDAPIGGGCVEVVRGSHAAGLATPLGGVIQPDILAARGAETLAEPLPARAGEVMLIHNHLWHRSGKNTSGRARRAFTVCYMSAETRCRRTKRAPRQFTRVFENGVSPQLHESPPG
ncbi:MAG: phytanoyl-CoA dioxygenase [Polyangiaceae bacterium]|nr:phytanoyl-CoA dioxygenase [Polyangiaceae bacterium]